MTIVFTLHLQLILDIVIDYVLVQKWLGMSTKILER